VTLPWSFSEVVAAEQHMAQLQHNMWVVNTKTAVLFDYHRRRQMGRDHHTGGPALPALVVHCGEKVLALC
jgi:hypothetical protein